MNKNLYVTSKELTNIDTIEVYQDISNRTFYEKAQRVVSESIGAEIKANILNNENMEYVHKYYNTSTIIEGMTDANRKLFIKYNYDLLNNKTLERVELSNILPIGNAWRYMEKIIIDCNTFPHGYRVSAYKRYAKIMERRITDKAIKQITVPNFDNESKGVDDILAYMKNKELYETKPKVQANTLIITGTSILEDIEATNEQLIKFGFLNNFSNVIVPSSYMMPFDYSSSSSRIKVMSVSDLLLHSIFLKTKKESPFRQHFKDAEAICFNLFYMPLRKKHIEICLSVLYNYAKTFPGKYFKDLSGKGKAYYKKYEIYSKLEKLENIDFY